MYYCVFSLFSKIVLYFFLTGGGVIQSAINLFRREGDSNVTARHSESLCQVGAWFRLCIALRCTLEFDFNCTLNNPNELLNILSRRYFKLFKFKSTLNFELNRSWIVKLSIGSDSSAGKWYIKFLALTCTLIVLSLHSCS